MSATIATIACLQRPRIPSNLADGYVMLDMTFYLHDSSSDTESNSEPHNSDPEPILKTALVRYFNSTGLLFNNDTDMYALVISSVAQIDKTTISDFLPCEENLDDYAFMGDILYIAPLSIEELPSVPPYVFLAGNAMNVNKKTASWEMAISQYCLGKKDAVTAVKSHIPDGPRWIRGKPVPSDFATIAAAGFLDDISSTQARNGLVSQLNVAVGSIAFVGRGHSMISSTPSTPSPTPSEKRKPKVAAKRSASTAFIDRGSADSLPPVSKRSKTSHQGTEKPKSRGINSAQ